MTGARGLPMPVIAGPTAGGKSALAVAVAHELGRRGVPAQVLSADAFQVYRGMDIGTAKPTAEERGGVPHRLMDLVEPTERFTLHDWLREAEGVIAEVRGAGGVPIVVGGTHLYVKGLLEGVFEGPPPDEALRERLRAQGLAALRAELERVDPAAAARIHANDERRTVRALEVYHQTGRPISEHQGQWDRGARGDAMLVGLEWPSEAINRRINARVREMVARGLADEARGLWAAGRLGPQAREGLGYKQFVAHFEGVCSHDEAVERTKIETRRFAKNQRTWLRRLRVVEGSVWFLAEGALAGEMAQGVVDSMFARAGRG